MVLKKPMVLFVSLFCFLFHFHATSAQAQEEKVFSLEQSIAEALKNNWSLKATQEKIEQSVNVKKQAQADFLPKLGMSYGYTRLSEDPSFRSDLGGNISVGTQDNYQWKGSVSQPLFTGFALISSYELAKLGMDMSQLEFELGKLDLALNVKQAYFGILIADTTVDVAEKDVASRQSNVDVARSFYKVGMIPVNDLLRAEVELGNTQQNLIKARNGAQQARAAFNIVLSRPIHAPAEVEDILAYKPKPMAFEELLAQALENRPEIKMIDIGILQADQQIRLAQSSHYPDVSLVYDYIKEGDSPSVSGSSFHDGNRWQATAVCTWTFWEWGKTYYSVREKESLKNELLKTRMALEDSIRLELKDVILEIATAEENIPTTKKAVEQGEENLRVNDERYKAQVSTITEVLDAQSILTQARVNYYTALYTHHLARASLLRALGTY